MDATSMINGMSSENPALDFARYIERAWSLYDRTGERIKKMGAA